MDTQEMNLENGPGRAALIVGNTVSFWAKYGLGPILFKIGTVEGIKKQAVHMLGVINPETPEEMNCEIYYNPDKRESFCGMIYNIKQTSRPMLAANQS